MKICMYVCEDDSVFIFLTNMCPSLAPAKI